MFIKHVYIFCPVFEIKKVGNPKSNLKFIIYWDQLFHKSKLNV